jgi:hypothetical protein
VNRKPIGLTTPYRKVNKDRDGWVNLTDDEVKQTLLDYNMGASPHRVDCIREIERLLKEKNT